MNWITVKNKRINADALASYGVNEDGDSYVVWSHGGMTKYRGRAFAEALDEALEIRTLNRIPAKSPTSLPDYVLKKVHERNERQEEVIGGPLSAA